MVSHIKRTQFLHPNPADGSCSPYPSHNKNFVSICSIVLELCTHALMVYIDSPAYYSACWLYSRSVNLNTLGLTWTRWVWPDHYLFVTLVADLRQQHHPSWLCNIQYHTPNFFQLSYMWSGDDMLACSLKWWRLCDQGFMDTRKLGKPQGRHTQQNLWLEGSAATRYCLDSSDWGLRWLDRCTTFIHPLFYPYSCPLTASYAASWPPTFRIQISPGTSQHLYWRPWQYVQTTVTFFVSWPNNIHSSQGTRPGITCSPSWCQHQQYYDIWLWCPCKWNQQQSWWRSH